MMNESVISTTKVYLDLLATAQRPEVRWSSEQICCSIRWAKIVEVLEVKHQVSIKKVVEKPALSDIAPTNQQWSADSCEMTSCHCSMCSLTLFSREFEWRRILLHICLQPFWTSMYPV